MQSDVRPLALAAQLNSVEVDVRDANWSRPPAGLG
jgi:hypothetical protein